MEAVLALRIVILEEYNKLAQQLENTYLKHVTLLLKQKSFIHEQIQKSLHVKLFELDAITNKYKNINININPNESIWQCVICDKQCRNKNEYSFHIKCHSTKDVETLEMLITKDINIEKEELMNNYKKEAELFKFEGNKLFNKKKYERAISQYTKAINLDPMNAVYFSNRAAAYMHLKKYKQAAVDALKTSEIDPNNVKAFMRLGVAEHAMKHYEKAYNAYLKVTSKFVQNEENRKLYQQIEARMKLCKNELPHQCGKCGKCGKLFTKQQDLTKHMIQHSGPKQFVCSQCLKPFKHKKDLKKHFKNVHIIHVNQQNNEKKSTAPNGMKPAHKRATKPFVCSQCCSAFKRRGNFKNHMVTHSNTMPFKCNGCSKAFKRKQNLKTHMKTHNNGHKKSKLPNSSMTATSFQATEARPFICGQCSSAFKQRAHLKNHMSTHSDDRPFECSQCSSAFKRRCYLTNHMLTHSSDRPFKCSKCCQAFKRKHNLKRHMETHLNRIAVGMDFVNLLKRIIVEIQSISDLNVCQIKQLDGIYENVLFTEQCIKRPVASYTATCIKKEYKTYDSFKKDIGSINSDKVTEMMRNVGKKEKERIKKISENMEEIQKTNDLHPILSELINDMLKAPTLNVFKSLNNKNVGVCSLYQIQQKIHDKQYSTFGEFVNDLKKLQQFCYELNKPEFKIGLKTLPKQFENKLKPEMKRLLILIDADSQRHFTLNAYDKHQKKKKEINNKNEE